MTDKPTSHGTSLYGAGWGGPAKGAGAGPEALIPGQPPEKRLITAENVRAKAERLAHLEDRLFDLSMVDERDMVSVAAAKALHAILDGQPIARQLNATAEGGVSGLLSAVKNAKAAAFEGDAERVDGTEGDMA